MTTPVLHLIAGPNGAGKSTLAEHAVQPVTHLPFVNADHLAAERWPGKESEHAYDASRAAAQERVRLLTAGASFITETVFSHPSKVELVENAVARGYLVHLHVVLVPPTLPVARVAARVAHGGHDVPEDKILARYDRVWPLVAQALRLADRARAYDNSVAAPPFRVVARFERGRLVGTPEWPAWTPARLLA